MPNTDTAANTGRDLTDFAQERTITLTEAEWLSIHTMLLGYSRMQATLGWETAAKNAEARARLLEPPSA